MRLPLVRLLLPILLLACGDGGAGRGSSTRPAPEASGTAELVWEATAAGDEEAASLFGRMAVRRVRAVYGPEKVRLELIGGLAPGTMIIDPREPAAILLDPRRRRFERAGSLLDLGERPDVTLEATGESETIAGRRAKEYVVTDSPDVREGARVRVWLDEALPLPVCRYRAEFDLSRLESPVPVMLSGPAGAALRVIVAREALTVTWIATTVRPGAPEPGLLEVPADYESYR